MKKTLFLGTLSVICIPAMGSNNIGTSSSHAANSSSAAASFSDAQSKILTIQFKNATRKRLGLHLSDNSETINANDRDMLSFETFNELIKANKEHPLRRCILARITDNATSKPYWFNAYMLNEQLFNAPVPTAHQFAIPQTPNDFQGDGANEHLHTLINPLTRQKISSIIYFIQDATNRYLFNELTSQDEQLKNISNYLPQTRDPRNQCLAIAIKTLTESQSATLSYANKANVLAHALPKLKLDTNWSYIAANQPIDPDQPLANFLHQLETKKHTLSAIISNKNKQEKLEHCLNALLQTKALLQAFANTKANKSNGTPLLIACQNGHTELIQQLIKLGANINQLSENGSTPLHMASAWGRTKVAQLLIENDANINLANPHDSATPLHLACSDGHINMVKLLVQHGANIDKADIYGATPLMTAAEGRDPFCLRIVKFLIKNKADVNKTDIYGNTALIAALYNSFPFMWECLAFKSDLTIKNNDGKTALDVANELRDPWAIRILKKAQAANSNQANTSAHAASSSNA